MTEDLQLGELRQTLDQIKQDAQTEEETGFDPSGTSGHLPVERDLSADSSSNSVIKSSDAELESLATGLSDFTWEDSVKNDRATQPQWEHLSNDGKEDRLSELLPQMNRTTIRFTLRKNQSRFDQSMDELLLLAFLDEDEKQNADSLEPYSVGAYRGKGRKKRSRKNGHGSLHDAVASTTNTSTESLPTRNVWTTSKEDVDFIRARTALSTDLVSSIYHSNGASLPATISTLAMKHAPTPRQMESTDPTLQIKVADLAQDYPQLRQDMLFGLFTITNNDASKTNELIHALLRSPASSRPLIPAQITPHYAPLPVHSEKSSNIRTQIPSSSSTTPLTDPYLTQQTASTSRIAGSEAFTKASSAYRRGKSDRHFGAVAAYYSDIGREHMRAAREQSSSAANSLVSMKSTPSSIDLHGVSVMDAVRIASQRTQTWWDSLGDSKLVPGGTGAVALREGFRIVTGVGRHSKDGAPKVGPAVTKRLINEGWKVDLGQGELLVTGKRRS